MGYDRHHAIIVTTYAAGRIVKARQAALDCFGLEMVSEIQTSPINEWFTFFVGPDGSMEGWEDSDTGDAARDAFVNWLVGECFEDGSNPYCWTEVQYGDSDGEQQVTRANRLTPDYPWNPGLKEELDEETR